MLKLKTSFIIFLILLTFLATFNLNFAQLIKTYIPYHIQKQLNITIITENSPTSIIPDANNMTSIQLIYQNDIITEIIENKKTYSKKDSNNKQTTENKK